MPGISELPQIETGFSVIGFRSEHVDLITEDDLYALKGENSSVYQAFHDLPSLYDARRGEDGQYWACYSREPDAGRAGTMLGRRACRRPFVSGIVRREKLTPED